LYFEIRALQKIENYTARKNDPEAYPLTISKTVISGVERNLIGGPAVPVPLLVYGWCHPIAQFIKI